MVNLHLSKMSFLGLREDTLGFPLTPRNYDFLQTKCPKYVLNLKVWECQKGMSDLHSFCNIKDWIGATVTKF